MTKSLDDVLPEFTAAQQLQRKLLPPDDLQFGAYRIHYQFQAAAKLSGDLIDCWSCHEDSVMFVVADVSGHGMASAMLSVWLTAFRGSMLTPAALLTQINRQLCLLNLEQHITAFVALLNYTTGELSWSSAGHYPPSLVFEQGELIDTLIMNNLALGMRPTSIYEQETRCLTPQMKCWIGSDGCLELFDGTLLEQQQQLYAQVASMNQLPLHIVHDDVSTLFICGDNYFSG